MAGALWLPHFKPSSQRLSGLSRRLGQDVSLWGVARDLLSWARFFPALWLVAYSRAGRACLAFPLPVLRGHAFSWVSCGGMGGGGGDGVLLLGRNRVKVEAGKRRFHLVLLEEGCLATLGASWAGFCRRAFRNAHACIWVFIAVL